MFFLEQPEVQRKEYEKFLKIAGALSNLFSESDIPALYYRVAERVFCRAFQAEDLSRGDVSVDAKKNSLGVGLKTFLANNNKTFQKVAEFNDDRKHYSSLSPEALVRKVSELRNARIEFTEHAYAIEQSIYHCVVREKGKFFIYEEGMDMVDIAGIKKVKENKGSISFEDGKNEYSFLVSKSTLTKRFNTVPAVYEFDVKIIADPLRELENILQAGASSSRIKSTVYLPLYSTRDGSVPEKSGLNQWNAEGRTRDANEVYIPVPSEVHRNNPGFFPDRDTPFTLKLPNGKTLEVKICQEGGKALMSKSNRELGEWLLRDVLGLKEGELFTDEKMEAIGIDSVRIDKISESEFEINFSGIGSYEKFRETFPA